MNHFKTIIRATNDLANDFPHTPDNYAQSITDFLEAQLALGWKLLAVNDGTNAGTTWIFQAVAQ